MVLIDRINGRVFVNRAKTTISSRKVKPSTMKNDVWYKMGQDNILKRCLSTIKA
jgi:hypothetical protein